MDWGVLGLDLLEAGIFEVFVFLFLTWTFLMYLVFQILFWRFR